ncbi:MAG: PAS domain-containing protein, partial [Spirochaetota bacterium]
MEWSRPPVIWFPFLVSVLSFSVGMVAYARAPRSVIVRLFAHFSITQSLLAFIEWGYRHAPTEPAAQAWVDAGALWPLSVATLWSFGWMISVGRNRPRLAPWRALMYLPAVALVVAGFASPEMQRVAVERWWGFSYELDPTPLMSIALSWGGLCSLVIAILVARSYRHRSQELYGVYRAFLLATLGIVAVNVVEAGAQAISTVPLPEFSTIGTGVFVAITGFAVARYGMWEFAPGTASETVLETMGDAVVLVDDRQNIRYLNPAAVTILGPVVEVVGAPASDYLPASLLGSQALGESLDATIGEDPNVALHVSARVEAMPARIGGRVLVLRDTGEQIRHREELSYPAFH